QGARQPLFRKVIGDQGKSARSESRFSHADTHPGKEQRAEASGAGAQSRHHAPEQNANRDERGAATSVGNLPNRDPKASIEQRESQALEQAYARVAEAEVSFDRTDQQAEDLSIDERQRVADHQHEEDVGRVPEAGRDLGLHVRRWSRARRSYGHGGYFFSSPNRSR